MSSTGDAAAATSSPVPSVEPVPAEAAQVFGDRLGLATRYADLLVTDGVLRGVIGPREPPRVWSRHLLNCAVVSELFEPGSRGIDVGSGAGLPGIALAIRRPDLRVDLLEPLERRVDFLLDAVARLGVGSQVRVVRGRAEAPATAEAVDGADWVTARAVAPMDRLVRWCLPLLAPAGRLALLKGRSVRDELRRYATPLRRAGVAEPRIVSCGVGLIEPPTTVVIVAAAAGQTVGRKGRR